MNLQSYQAMYVTSHSTVVSILDELYYSQVRVFPSFVDCDEQESCVFEDEGSDNSNEDNDDDSDGDDEGMRVNLPIFFHCVSCQYTTNVCPCI